MAVGKRIYLQRRMPDHDVMMQFKTIPASNTADCMGRNCAMNPRIHLVSSPKDQMMVGPAFTVKCRAGDNLALHAALNYCHEGDVLVVSNEEDTTRALMGEVMMAYLFLEKKVAGIVLDGPIRDIDEIGKWDFPVYCTGNTATGLALVRAVDPDSQSSAPDTHGVYSAVCSWKEIFISLVPMWMTTGASFMVIAVGGIMCLVCVALGFVMFGIPNMKRRKAA